MSPESPWLPVRKSPRPIPFVYDDGGREAAGFKGEARDCVCRAIAIATGTPYREVYNKIEALAKSEKPRRRKNGRKRGRSTARGGVKKKTLRAVMEFYGLEWVPLMKIGSGCTVHLDRNELPAGTLIARVSKHVVAIVDSIARDTFDPTRGGKRCVYGYWKAPKPATL
jgi:hypothetical protein